MCGIASAAVVTYHYTDDKDSINTYASAATLNLQDASIDGLNGVLFTLEATLSDPMFAASSKILTWRLTVRADGSTISPARSIPRTEATCWSMRWRTSGRWRYRSRDQIQLVRQRQCF